MPWWMDKEVVVHVYNEILLSCKKECTWVSSNEGDEPRAYYTEWSKSEIERQILYIKCLYMASRKMVLMILHTGQQRRHRHKEQTFGLGGRRGWDDLREKHGNIILPYVK